METATHNETRLHLAEQLSENTGTHMLDSGGNSGRSWQRHKLAKDATGLSLVEYFNERTPSVVEFSIYKYEKDEDEWSPEITVTHDAYHWLSERLIYSEREDARFNEFATSENNKDKCWLECATDYVAENATAHGIYGEDDDVCTVNTYNNEDLLSQTLQYQLYCAEDEDGNEAEYIMLSTHNGADVRGGYSKPVAYELDNSASELAILDNARASLFAENTLDERQLRFDGKLENNSHHWDTHDGYNWESDEAGDLSKYIATDDEGKRGNGTHLYIDDVGNGYSPINGALLEVSAY